MKKEVVYPHPSYEESGLTKLEWFAGRALSGLLANPECDNTVDGYNKLAKKSVLLAGLILMALDDKQNGVVAKEKEDK